jgi:Ca2+-binding RTX toxin-like protein
MSQVYSMPGGNHKMTVYGNGTVFAGNGNDTITITGQGLIAAGNGKDTLTIDRTGTIVAGNGNDNITANGVGAISVGGGSDTISLLHNGGTIHQFGAGGHDTITLGLGQDTVYEAGHATISAQFGTAYVDDGVVKFKLFPHGNSGVQVLSGDATLIGGASTDVFTGGSGKTLMEGGKGADTFIGGSGHDTMVGGKGSNLFEFLSTAAGGNHVITNFVAGQDQLYLEGHSLSYLENHNDITTHGGNTYISLDGGSTTIELKGITNLTSSDITQHKD